MALDFVSIKEKLTAKGGFSITPYARMLDDLKNLLIDMTAQRKAPNSCPANTAFLPSSPASIGDYNSAADSIKGLTCSCQGKVDSCTCNSVGCTCESENTGCSCESQSVVSCSCDSFGECPSVLSCPSYSDSICTGVSQSGCSGLANNCSCNADSSTSCPSYAVGCGCDSYTAGCPCDTVVSNCPCNAYYGV